MKTSLEDYIKSCQDRINRALETHLQAANSPYCHSNTQQPTRTLFDAMQYSVLDGGKRIRPILLYAAADALKAPPSLTEDLDQLACAVEFIHAYSLIHDDLPAMDDDDLRRGKPSCHRAFDEATAILAGDALQAEAFDLISRTQLADSTKLRLIRTLAQAAGPLGMVGGQAIDLASVNKTISLDQLETMHRLKTGALIRASVAMGAIAALGPELQSEPESEPQPETKAERKIEALDQYATAIGLAFQVQDDILDIESDTQTLGKPQGADLALNKPTYPALIGLEAAKDKANALLSSALAALKPFDTDALRLQQLATFVVRRRY